jgi:hypothetical protein
MLVYSRIHLLFYRKNCGMVGETIVDVFVVHPLSQQQPGWQLNEVFEKTNVLSFIHCTEIVLFQPDFLLSLNSFMDLFSRGNEILNLDEKELVQQNKQRT